MQDTCNRFFVSHLLSLVFSELQGVIQYRYSLREGWIRSLPSLYPVTHKSFTAEYPKVAEESRHTTHVALAMRFASAKQAAAEAQFLRCAQDFGRRLPLHSRLLNASN